MSAHAAPTAPVEPPAEDETPLAELTLRRRRVRDRLGHPRVSIIFTKAIPLKFDDGGTFIEVTRDGKTVGEIEMPPGRQPNEAELRDIAVDWIIREGYDF